MRPTMQDSDSASKRPSHLVFHGFSEGSAELWEESVEPQRSCLTEHVAASLHCFMDLRCTIHPAQTSVDFAFHPKRDYRHLHAHYVDVVRFKIEWVSPIPVSHLDL